ncbi:hypothetical protein D9M70_626760 [compost metagenome]
MAVHVDGLSLAAAQRVEVGRRQLGRGAHPGDGGAVHHHGAVGDLATGGVHGDEHVGVANDQQRRALR